MKDLVSIIVPCFNSESFIAETLNSVLNQNYNKWECILIDDGSTDNTIRCLKKYLNIDSRFKLICQNHSGVSRARNTGLENSQGEFIQFLDSDDLLGPRKLEIQILQLQSNPQLDVVYSGARYFKQNFRDFFPLGRNEFFPTVELTEFDKDVLSVVKKRNPFVTPSPIYRKKSIEKVGLFDCQLTYLEDWDFQIRCALENLTFQYYTFNPQVGPFIRLREGSLTSDRRKILEAKLIFFSKYPQFFNKEKKSLKKFQLKNKLRSFFLGK